jgi:alkanesulfonate monooxygenase SsuD/methylene tetrahydromethanopterin reductase-like flavin-dependent oxidoreductase (luciferase family)
MAGYGADNQHESVTSQVLFFSHKLNLSHRSVSFSQALLHFTEKLNVIAALLPGPWNPAIAAKQIASIDQYTNG